MWDLPRPGIKPVSPALAGRFLTTEPPGKPGWKISEKTLEVVKLHATNASVSLPSRGSTPSPVGSTQTQAPSSHSCRTFCKDPSSSDISLNPWYISLALVSNETRRNLKQEEKNPPAWTLVVGRPAGVAGVQGTTQGLCCFDRGQHSFLCHGSLQEPSCPWSGTWRQAQRGQLGGECSPCSLRFFRTAEQWSSRAVLIRNLWVPPPRFSVFFLFYPIYLPLWKTFSLYYW